MKKIIFALVLLFVGISGYSQTYDNTMTNMKFAVITGVKNSFTDTANCTRLGIRVVSDDLKSFMTLNIVLSDSLGNVFRNENVTLTGTQYASWNRSINTLFNKTASYYGVTLK